MPFDIIPKKEIKKTNWLDIIFYISLILLLTACLGFFVLEYSLNQTEEKITQTETRIEQQESTKNKQLEKELLNTQKKINDFSIVLSNHKLNSKLFEFVEKRTHPQVSFSSFNFDSISGRLTLSGTAKNFTTLGEQLLILYAESDIQTLNVTNISLGENEGVSFGLDITISPQVFNLN